MWRNRWFPFLCCCWCGEWLSLYIAEQLWQRWFRSFSFSCSPFLLNGTLFSQLQEFMGSQGNFRPNVPVFSCGCWCVVMFPCVTGFSFLCLQSESLNSWCVLGDAAACCGFLGRLAASSSRRYRYIRFTCTNTANKPTQKDSQVYYCIRRAVRAHFSEESKAANMKTSRTKDDIILFNAFENSSIRLRQSLRGSTFYWISHKAVVFVRIPWLTFWWLLCAPLCSFLWWDECACWPGQWWGAGFTGSVGLPGCSWAALAHWLPAQAGDERWYR